MTGRGGVRTGRTALIAAAVGAVMGAACGGGGGTGGSDGTGGGGGAGGAAGCPDEVAPLFTLRVHASEGELPESLELAVSWSAGEEPPVVLGQAGTHGTSASNVICAVVPAEDVAGTSDDGGERGGGGPGGGRPGDDLLCELWTSGPTRVVITADGFVPVDETLAPATLDGCDRPVPSAVVIELVPEDDEEPGED